MTDQEKISYTSIQKARELDSQGLLNNEQLAVLKISPDDLETYRALSLREEWQDILSSPCRNCPSCDSNPETSITPTCQESPECMLCTIESIVSDLKDTDPKIQEKNKSFMKMIGIMLSFIPGIGRAQLRYFLSLPATTCRTLHENSFKFPQLFEGTSKDARLRRDTIEAKIVDTMFATFYYRIGGEKIFTQSSLIAFLHALASLQETVSNPLYKDFQPYVIHAEPFFNIVKKLRSGHLSLEYCAVSKNYYLVHTDGRSNNEDCCPFCKYRETKIH